jgi:hypothetical protein
MWYNRLTPESATVYRIQSSWIQLQRISFVSVHQFNEMQSILHNHRYELAGNNPAVRAQSRAIFWVLHEECEFRSVRAIPKRMARSTFELRALNDRMQNPLAPEEFFEFAPQRAKRRAIFQVKSYFGQQLP